MPYIHEDIDVVDLRKYPHISLETAFGSCHLHQIIYNTSLPKILELRDAADTNPYHLFVLMIARFYFFDNGESPIHYYYAKTDKPLVEDVLAALPSRFIRHTERDPQVEYMDLPGCAWYSGYTDEPWLCDYLQGIFSHILCTIPQIPKTRIFISRKDTAKRRLIDEELLYPELLKLGFSIYDYAHLSFEAQLRITRSADCIVAPHGAGMAWMIFCHKDTFILEINGNFPEKDYYYDLAKKRGLNYNRFTECSWDPKTENITMNRQVFFDLLTHFLRYGNRQLKN